MKYSFFDKRFGLQCNLLLLSMIVAFPIDAIQIDCNFSLSEIYLLGRHNKCSPTITLLQSATLYRVIGTHVSVYTHGDVSYLLVLNRNMPFIPQGVSNYFEKLKAITISISKFASINAKDLKQFPTLEFLRRSFLLHSTVESPGP